MVQWLQWEVRVLMIRTRIQVSMMLLGPPFGTFRVPPISPYSCPSSRELVNVAGRKSSSEVNSHQLADPRLIHNEIQTLLPITTDTSVVKRGLIEETTRDGVLFGRWFRPHCSQSPQAFLASVVARALIFIKAIQTSVSWRF